MSKTPIPVGYALSDSTNGTVAVRPLSDVVYPSHYAVLERIYNLTDSQLLKETAREKNEKVRQVLKWILKGKLEEKK